MGKTTLWMRQESCPGGRVRGQGGGAVGAALLLSLACAAESVAQPANPAALASAPSGLQHPWVAPVPRLTPEAYFTNVESGARIETPFLLKFGLSGGWGIAPIVSPVAGRAGHHHLLVNRDLPLDFKQPLPFNDQYIHFGKGQMEAVINLEPGKYTLRLLLADDKHLPHFVYSKPLQVTVTERKAAVKPDSLVKKGVALLNVAEGQKFKPPFRVQFHASGLNVAHQSQREKDTGHFKLTVASVRGGAPAELVFPNGQTEVWLAPPAGSYRLKLEFLDNVNPARVVADTVALTIAVEP